MKIILPHHNGRVLSTDGCAKQAQPSEHPNHGRGAGLTYQSSLRSPVMKAWPAGVPTPVMLS